MALSVGTNTGALMAQAAASSVSKSMEQSMERLATGRRINSAADDAAGVAIASRLTSEIKGTNQAIRNAMDGQAMLDTAEGAHIEIENILQRMRELAVQAGNDTNSAQDRTNISGEMTQLSSEIDRISSTTTWAGQNLLDGSGSFNFQVGSRTTNSDTISSAISSMSSAGLSLTTSNVTGAATSGTGSSQAAGVHTVANSIGATITDAGGTVHNSGIQSFSVSGGAGVTLTHTNNTLVLDLGTTAINSVVTMTINGTAFTQTLSAADDSVRASDGAILLGKVAAGLGVATGTSSNLAAGASTSTGDGTSTLTITRANMATDLTAKLNADTSFSAAFTATASTNDVGVTATPIKATVSATATTDATNTGVDATVVDNVITMTASSGAATSANNNTLTFTVEGKSVEFNSFTHGAAVGFDTSDITDADGNGLMGAIKNRLEAAGLSHLNMAISAATLTITKGNTLDVSSNSAAKNTVDAIDAAITSVNTQRATLGAVSNRLDSTVSNLTNISANLSAGRGRIEDADFAAETTSLAKSQILQQASTAMLAQANASKQGVLSLLQG
jgi:flagellin